MPKSSNRKNETRRVNRDRKQRLEEMRRAQRAAERRKNFLFAGSAIVVAIILITAAVVPAYLHDRAKTAKLKRESKVGFVAPLTAAEKTAGCLGVHSDPVSVSPTNSHVETAVDYSTQKYGDTAGGTPPIPPTGGHHNPVSLGDTVRFYPLSAKPRPERAVHNLEHGYVVVWYDSKLPAADVTQLQALAKSGSFSRLLVVGWWQGDLPEGKHVVLTSWGRTDRCGTVSNAVVSKFYSDHLNSSLAPEAGLGPISGADNYPPGTLPGAGAPTPGPSASTSTSTGTGTTTTPAPTTTK